MTEGGLPDIVAARRLSGLAYLHLGALSDARIHLEEAIRSYDPDWNSATIPVDDEIFVIDQAAPTPRTRSPRLDNRLAVQMRRNTA
jgi:hypothetical protein